MDTLFAAHIDKLIRTYTDALKVQHDMGLDLEAVLIHSGSEQYYHGDDRDIPFQAFGHFRHWLPVERPDQLIYFAPGRKPVYYQVIPEDYWYEQSIDCADWWSCAFEVVTLSSLQQLPRHLPDTCNAYLGGHPELAEAVGIAARLVNPAALLAYLDFERAYKSDYELEQLRAANRVAMQGHRAATTCFLAGGSERQIHSAFLEACDMLESDSPYTNIVALNEKSAILHYQNKRGQLAEQSNVLLIDAGSRVNGYCSDVTRTSVSPGVNERFQQLLQGMDQLEQDLVAEVAPGRPYLDIHLAALTGIAHLLRELEICKGGRDELWERQIPQLFMPHGVGHLLGIQVHDVGGHLADRQGDLEKPPQHSPMLRNTRLLAENMAFTIEPGCYFIPLLLEPERDSERGKLINWALVDELYPLGGIRVEDNVRVTQTGSENLTRPFEQ